MAGVEHGEIALRAVAGPLEAIPLQEAEGLVVAGRQQDQVDFRRTAVGEDDLAALERPNVRLGRQLAAAQVVEHLGVQDRVGFEDPVVRFGQATAAEVADQQAQQQAEAPLAEAHGQLRHGLGEDIGGQPEDVLGDEVVAPAQAEECGIGRRGGVAGDVAAGVAGADDQHPLAAEDLGAAVADGVAELALETAGDVRQMGLPGHAVGADQAPVAAFLAARQRDPPARAVRHRPRDLALEDDMVVEAVGKGEGPQVGQDLPVVRIVRIVAGHGKVEEGGERLRGDEACRVVHRRAMILQVPDTAHITMPLDHLERHAGPQEGARLAEAGRSGADNAKAVTAVGAIRCRAAAGHGLNLPACLKEPHRGRCGGTFQRRGETET